MLREEHYKEPRERANMGAIGDSDKPMHTRIKKRRRR